ncbi:LexA family protein [Acetomicrobium sp. S15 = DSM 107314]|uniref:LexA family protein n=1 Tax=Acetomicrobium sp. S15 = DSM 107314 TaxID=2529858 RepID=UPI0018E1B396|nr:LexA family transcriptional regulator [Acetomicrobium sp. S15 = DSM 107314]
MLTGDEIRKARKAKNLTQSELAAIIGVSRSAIYDWERGKYSPTGERAIKLANALGLSVTEFLPDYLLEERKPNEAAPTNHNIILVPLLSDVTRACCGMGNGYEFPDDTIEGRLAVDVDALGPIRTNGMFACRVEGDSMAAARIYDGDIIVVAPEEEPIDGDVVLACYGAHQRWMIRWFYAQRDGSIILKAANPEYPDIKITPEDVDCGWYRYLGKVIAYQGSPKKGI